PASRIWLPACCRSRSITMRSSRRCIRSRATSWRSWRGSLAASDRDKGQDGQRLIEAARQAREHAQAPYSHLKVGAALETADGIVITGCNIENASYGLSMCAERVALFKALSEGHRSFVRIAVAIDKDHVVPPCGACRQLLWEYGGNLEVQLANLNTRL